MPTTRMAGNTSKVSDQLTIARTSQKGTRIAVKGSISADHGVQVTLGSAVTTARVCTGVPMAPQATGAVFAMRFSAAA